MPFTQTLAQRGFLHSVRQFAYKYQKEISTIIALNIFSTIAFMSVENTIFRYFFGMTLLQSLKARGLAFLFNTPMALLWPKIEKVIKKFMERYAPKLVSLSEELSLFVVKLVVNACIYLLVGAHTDMKLAIKAGVIVLLSFLLADFLKYKMTTFIRTFLFGKHLQQEQMAEPIMTFSLQTRTMNALRVARQTPTKRAKKRAAQKAMLEEVAA